MKPRTSLTPGMWNNLRYDLPAGLVVFLVALPLCLGIALASEAPLFSGVITGIVAGMVVGTLSGSQLSVSGPAAGLTVIVASSIHTLGGFEAFLCAVVLAGAFQVVLGLCHAGLLAGLFPLSVIKGMLVAIGLTIILKQIPHAVGGQGDFDDEMGFWHLTGQDNAVGEIARALYNISPSATIICISSLILLIYWESDMAKRHKYLSLVPGPLVTVVLGAFINQFFHLNFPGLGLKAEDGHLVQLPHLDSFAALVNELKFPAWEVLSKKAVWIAALTIAAVGSVETLLCIESTDKMDPFRRTSNNNRELLAQGTGNILAGLIGGIPMTSVIVRSSANIYAGARTRMSAIFHGLILLLCVFLIPHLLNLIPLASLAAVLLVVGYKLAHPSLFKKMFALGADQWVPFVVTVIAILMTDLLTGVFIGLVVGLGVVLKTSYYSAFQLIRDGNDALIRFTKDVTFVHKVKLKRMFTELKPHSKVVIDGHRAMFVDYDILELIEDFAASAADRSIQVEIRNLDNKRFKFLMKGSR